MFCQIISYVREVVNSYYNSCKYFLCHTIIIPSLTIMTFNIPITVYTVLSGRIIALPPLWLLSEKSIRWRFNKPTSLSIGRSLIDICKMATQWDSRFSAIYSIIKKNVVDCFEITGPSKSHLDCVATLKSSDFFIRWQTRILEF